jgi:hypothetical protein
MKAATENNVRLVFFAYILAAYFVAFFFIVTGASHPGLILAPLAIPYALGFGVGEILKAGEPSDIIPVLGVTFVLSLAVLGFRGLLRAVYDGWFAWWPVLLLILDALLIYLLIDGLVPVRQ